MITIAHSRALALIALALAVACDDEPDRRTLDGQPGDAGADRLEAAADAAGADTTGRDVTTAAAAVTCSALAVSGDPESSEGAKWTYEATDRGVAYELRGALFRPRGTGPFPGVVLSHGKGGSPDGFPTMLAREMVKWGVVGIAPDYTHAQSPAGTPVGPDGASAANLLRAHKARDLLSCLGYVSMDRIAAHGHSMGAFVTTALVGTHPDAYHVASHTAGGVNDNAAPPYPSNAQVSAIEAPYQIHHGASDTLVALEDDQRLADLLNAQGVAVELHVYPGYRHNDVAPDATMLSRVKTWYTSSGLWK